MQRFLKEYLRGARRVGFFGLGKSNLSLISMLPSGVLLTLRGDSAVDLSKLPDGVCIERVLCRERALDDINEDILFLSPSVRRDRPELIVAKERGVTLSSDAELFFKAVNAPVLAVSGSAGKSTTATLSALLINEATKESRFGKHRDTDVTERKEDKATRRAILCGNVGTPMLEAIRENATVYVAELSSFMLMDHKATVKRSAITNITENHLDWHTSFDEYRKAKLSLLSFSDQIIINASDPLLSEFAGRSRRVFGAYSVKLSLPELLKLHRARYYMTLSEGYICRNGERLIDISKLSRREDFNIANMMCALLLSEGYYSPKSAESVLSRFTGLRHRGETVASINGVRFVNSSIDTTPERSAATLNNFDGQLILLLGGKGKGLSYEPLISAIREKARMILTFGEEGERIASLMPRECAAQYLGSFENAVLKAISLAGAGDTVLLSPACTSYDEFSSFEERGDKFKSLVLSAFGNL